MSDAFESCQVRNFFYHSYRSVESVIDEWRPPGPGMILPYDDAADVILDMLSRENRSDASLLLFLRIGILEW